MTKGFEMEVASLAKSSDVLIGSECGIHDDSETCYLVQDFDLSQQF